LIPQEIKQYQPKGTEIQQKGDKYYVATVTGHYEDGVSKRRYGQAIGKIIPGIGFVPNKQGLLASDLVTKEYGATRVIMALSDDVFQQLRKSFPHDFIRVYVIAVLKLLNNLASKDLSLAYAKSAISVMMPGVHLSKNTVPDFLSKFSLQRGCMLEFMRECSGYEGDSVIFDGSSFLSSSGRNPFVRKGYSPGNKGKKQVRLMYAFNTETHMPIYFKVVPGNISDKAAFITSYEELGSKRCTLILDKGFNKKQIIDFVLKSKARIIIPLPSNTTEVDETFKDFLAADRHGANESFKYNKRVIRHRQFESKRFEGCKVFVYYDYQRHQYLTENHMSKELSEEQEATLAEDTARFGVTMLFTNIDDKDARQLYYDYKTRWLIEEMFDTHKNTLGFSMNYETTLAAQEAWAFIEYLSLLIYYRIHARIISADIASGFDVKDLLFQSSTITQSKVTGCWSICNLTQKMSDLFKKMDVTLEPLISSIP
jgi:hypothetical protein